jgi:Tfp pilus assembly protein PilW
MKKTRHFWKSGRQAFTLLEVILGGSLGGLIMISAISVYLSCWRVWRSIDARMEADQDVNLIMNRMVYGVSGFQGIRSASQVTLVPQGSGWALFYQTKGAVPQTNSFTYSATSSNLIFNPGAQTIGTDLSLAQVIVSASQMIVTLRVDRVVGGVAVRREIGTGTGWRN